MLPALFVSHGSPQVLIEDSAARDFLRGFAATMPKPRAIVIASAHFGTHRPAVVGDAKPGMIYDFGGMPELHQLIYPAPGDPVVAMKVAGLLQAAGLAPVVATGHGYDHGTWVPLMLLYPDADVPVIQLSVQPRLDPAHHLAVGRALASLKEEDILVIGSGSATHNLREFYYGSHPADGPAMPWVAAFTDWVDEKIAAGALDELLRYRERAPYAVENHPTDEHFMPLFIGLGAGNGAPGRRVHTSTRSGVISMDTYMFGWCSPGDFTGPLPEDGHGWGYQIDGFLSYRVNDVFSVGLGGRFWHMQANGHTHFENHIVGVAAVPQVVNWKTDNYGVFLQSSVKLGPHGLFGSN